MGNFFQELKRRNVVKVAIAFAVVGWAVLQFVDIVNEPLGLPEWFQKVVIVLLAIGFPIALIISWAFEITPEGLKKTAEVDKNKSITPKTGQRINKLIAGALILALAFIAYDKFSEPGTETVKEARAGQPSIAVLPFDDLSPTGDQEYFADGISEEILNVLAGVKEMKVTSRSSSFSLKGQNLDVPAMGKKLGVDYILEGSVRKQGDRVRITAQLIDVGSDSHLWSNTYDRQSADIFDVQEDIAKAISDALQIQFGTGQGSLEVKAPTMSREAHEEYLKGRYYWNLRTFEDIYTAKDHFEKAISLDPGYALAYLGLAESLVLIPDYNPEFIDQRDIYLAAEGSAKKALELDPSLGQAHTTLGFILYELDRWGEAFAEFERAIKETPDYATAWQWYGNLMTFAGKNKEGERYLAKARELDPMSRIILSNYADILIVNGKYDQAQKALETGLALYPDFGLYNISLSELDYVRGDFAAMRANLEKYFHFLEADPEITLGWLDLIEAYRKTGNPAPVPEKLLVNAKKPDLYNSPADLVYLSGHHDLALEQVRALFGLTGPRYVLFYTLWWPTYGPLRKDPGIKDALRDAGFVDLWKTYGWPDKCKPKGDNDFECE